MATTKITVDPEYPGESLIQTREGAEEGTTLLSIGLGSVKHQIRSFFYQQIDDNPQDERYYIADNGVLREVALKYIKVTPDEDGEHARLKYGVFPGHDASEPLFTFDTVVRTDV